MSAARKQLMLELSRIKAEDRVLLYRYRGSTIWIQSRNNKLPIKRPKHVEYKWATMDDLPA